MKVYQLRDGTLVGFYQEEGAELTVQYFEDVWEQQLVTKTRVEVVREPDRYVMVRMPAHTEIESRKYLILEKTEYRPVVVEEHYEYKTWTEAAHWGTREYWLEPHIEIQYRYEGEPGLEAGRAGWVAYEEEVPGCWQERRIWFPDVTRTTKKWVPMHEEIQLVTIPEHHEVIEEEIYIGAKYVEILVKGEAKTKTVEYKELEEVFIGRLPVYSLVDPEKATMFKVEELIKAPADEPGVEDIITVRNVLTGEVLRTTASYIGMATRLDDNEFVVP